MIVRLKRMMDLSVLDTNIITIIDINMGYRFQTDSPNNIQKGNYFNE